MKGVIYNILEKAVVRTYGEDAWDDILDRAKVDGIYHSMGSYDDRELIAIIAAAAALLDKDAAEVTYWAGTEAIKLFHESWPHFFEPHGSTIDFLMTLNDIIHPEVEKLYPGAKAPTFVFNRGGQNSLEMTYLSSRNLCHLAEGLIVGSAGLFHETISVTQKTCALRGDAQCVFQIEVAPQ